MRAMKTEFGVILYSRPLTHNRGDRTTKKKEFRGAAKCQSERYTEVT